MTESIENIKKIRTKRDKGKSLLELKRDFTVLDLETTGLSPLYDEIIEIGALKVRDGKIIDKFHCFCKIENELSEFITEFTGITSDMLKDGYSQNTAVEKVIKFIGDDIILGHNINFDINFLYDISNNNNLKLPKNDFIDVLRISRFIFKELDNHRLNTLCSHLEIEQLYDHRAIDDCKSVLKVYDSIINYIYNNYEHPDMLFEKTKNHKSSLKAKDIYSEKSDFDASHPLYGKVCVFTGTLEKMKRAEAMQIVVDLGGINADTVTKKTNFLILGNNDYCSTIKNGKSRKHKKAEDMKLKGMDIEIIPEEIFYDLI